MLDYINAVTGWLAYPEVRAVLVGLIVSWNGTQIIKNAPSLVAKAELVRRWNTRAIAFLLGWLPTAALWPGHWHERALIGVAVGLAAPTIYTYGARVLYHYFPWLESKMSAAQPESPLDGDL